ncbi:MAG: class I SAM-dependent methyltransferase [Nitrospiraceae bacterium]
MDQYWAEHVVCPKRFASAQESEDYLGVRFKAYPLFRELSGLYGDHQDEVILDYGCGPGHDLIGFALYTQAQKIIGMDVSEAALRLAVQRLKLHEVSSNRVELVLLSDATPIINLADNSVDFINCQGVLQHVTYPERVLREFFRVLKPTGRAVIMVYNRNSVWFHLYTAYEKLVVEKAFSGLDTATAFSKNVDGVTCPVARCYVSEDFSRICERIGFVVAYAGGLFVRNRDADNQSEFYVGTI